MKVIFLGGQGSGKSTQAKLLSEKLELPLIEMGQLLRNRAKKEDDLGHQLDKTLKSGNLVKNEDTIAILRERLARADCIKGYILDGFPRNFAQYNAQDEDIDIVFYVKVSDEEATRRLMLRARNDDTQDALRKRLEIYHQETEPLLEKFKQKEILQEIDGEQSIEYIHKEILEIAKSHKKYQ